jgi:hypothetical protein
MHQLVENIKRTVEKKPVIILLALFILVQVVLFYKLGIRTEIEAEKYIREGENLYKNEGLSAPKYIFYLPIIFLIYLSKVLGLGYGFVVLLQVLLSGYATISFYQLCQTLTHSKIKGLAGALLLAIFIPLQSWNFYLYSDSIFISLVILFLSVVHKHANGGWPGVLKILLFLVLLIFSRPHGLLLIPPVFFYLVLRKQTKASRIKTVGIAGLFLTLMYFLLNKAFKGGEDMDAMKPFIEEHIICFVPLKPEGASLDLIKTDSPVKNLLYYVTHNPLHYLKLMALKLWSFFNITRPYYSLLHNILLCLYIIPLYFFAVAGIRRFWKNNSDYALFILGLIILYPLGATLQCDDWHSRFTMVVIPSLIIISIFYSSKSSNIDK